MPLIRTKQKCGCPEAKRTGRHSRKFLDLFSLNLALMNADLGFPRFLDHTNIARFAAIIPAAFLWRRRSPWISVASRPGC
jgi:hypothetical protein